MKIYDIHTELAGRRAIVSGEYKNLQVGCEITIADNRGNEYRAVVETRIYGGVVVKVLDFI